jgi:hypothetical protein
LEPILCIRDPQGRLIVKEGQHRLLAAIEAQVPVIWYEPAKDFDIARVASIKKNWSNDDHAHRYMVAGIPDYTAVKEFSDTNRISILAAACLLAGSPPSSAVSKAFKTGTYRVTEAKFAQRVITFFNALSQLQTSLRNNTFLNACVSVHHVSIFNPDRLYRSAKRLPNALKSYSTKDAYLTMLEEIYNHHYSHEHKIALRMLANTAMAKRMAVKRTPPPDDPSPAMVPA